MASEGDTWAAVLAWIFVAFAAIGLVAIGALVVILVNRPL